MRFRHPALLSIFAAAVSSATAQTLPPPTETADGTLKLDPIVVNGALDRDREAILPSLGATAFGIDSSQLDAISQGSAAPFNQVLLRAPGVAEDSAANGDLHVRGEHANLQYRINDILLPEGITGFGLELDPRFVGSLQLITGSLPAQYGFRTAGVVDIQTKAGTGVPGGDVSVYGGSFGTIRPSFEADGTLEKTSYFVDGSYDHNDLGIENPTASSKALHDETNQGKLFTYLSRIIDPSSRVSVMVSASDSAYQVPDTPGLPPGTSPDGDPWLPGKFDSSRLNENQNEQNYYGVIAYQKSAGELNYQISALGRASSVHFLPDPVGDLFFNGVASDVERNLHSFGLQGDASYAANDRHTLRIGAVWLDESVAADSTTTVFPVNGDGDPDGPSFPITDDHSLHGLFAGLYVQDEWKISPGFTVNYGARFDVFNSSFDNEDQVSPRLNFIYKVASTTLHAGYARYFTPPPVENVSGASVAKFDGTSNDSATDQDGRVKAERSDYFDAGISQQIATGLQVGLDGYFKEAKNQLDDGLFGQTLILSAFNYAQGRVDGLELTSSYSQGGFSVYANAARSDALGKNWSSAQFLFDPSDLAYVQNHWIHLDHDQALTGSLGTSYQRREGRSKTRVYGEALYGSGLRTDSTAPDGSNIPNGGKVPAYHTFNAGAEQLFGATRGYGWKVRLDIVNLADKSYELRDGSGVGVNAAQFGMRRAIFGSVGCAF